MKAVISFFYIISNMYILHRKKRVVVSKLNICHRYRKNVGIISLANTTNRDRTSLVEDMEGKPRRKRDIPLENITIFRRKHDVFSNFYPCTIRVFERTFASSKHAYQFMKAMSHGKVNVAKDIIQV